MLHAASASAPAACAALRPPSPDDLAERLAIVAEDPASDPTFLRTALLRTHGFVDDEAFADAHRSRLRRRLEAFTGKTAIELRLRFVAQAFIASDWYLAAVRHGWSDAELFGWDGAEAETTLETAALVPALALCCPKGARLTALESWGATLTANNEDRRLCALYRFGRPIQKPFFEP
jgi:hypothetical protein